MTQRAKDILDTLENDQDITMIGQNDTMDLFRILINLLHQFGAVLPVELHAACQGALAINQATGLARRAGGTNVKSPTAMVKTILRYTSLAILLNTRNLIIMIPLHSRKVLHELVEFTCDFSQRASSRTRNVWAKQLSIVFGHALEASDVSHGSTPSKKVTDAGWKALFFELLIHSHGLHSEAYVSNDKKDIWTLDEEFEKELKVRYQLSKTPSKRAKMGLTPNRRSVTRMNPMMIRSGSCVKKRIFKPSNLETSVGLQNGLFAKLSPPLIL